MSQHPWLSDNGKPYELPVSPTPEMIEAGSRSIGNTMRWQNHQERANACWMAMVKSYYDDKKEPWPTQPLSKGPDDDNS